MKKKPHSINETIEYVSVYRDEIDEIYNLLSNASEEVEIEADEFELDSIDELEKIKKDSVENLELRTLQPWISVSISKYGVRVHASENNEISENVRFKIQFLFDKKINRIVKFMDKHNFLFFSPMLLGGLLLTFYKAFPPIINYISLALFIIGFVFMLISLYVTASSLGKTRIYLAYRKDKPSFLSKNRDEIIVGIFMLILGAILGKVF